VARATDLGKDLVAAIREQRVYPDQAAAQGQFAEHMRQLVVRMAEQAPSSTSIGRRWGAVIVAGVSAASSPRAKCAAYRCVHGRRVPRLICRRVCRGDRSHVPVRKSIHEDRTDAERGRSA